MNRLLKSWVFWVFVAMPAAVTIVGLIHRERERQVCIDCFSERLVSRWKIGVKRKASWPLSPVGATVVESNVHRDGWAEPHQHQWHGVTFDGGAFAYAGTGNLLGRYEGYAEFRAFMIAKRERRELAREDFLAALAFPSGLIVCGRVEPENVRLRRERMDVLVAEFLRKTYRP